MLSNALRPCGRTSCAKILKRGYVVLGIESSCDDTGAAVVSDENDEKILGDSHYSQHKLHNQCGGIVPHVAQKLHAFHIKNIVETAMEKSSLRYKDLTAVAVTVKPGLIMSLEQGVDFAKNLCKTHNKPLLPVHHMEAHALTARMIEKVTFPFLTFLISGGHCILALVKSTTEFYTLGKSMDISPGEVLDKAARRIKLFNLERFRELCGGKAIETAALDGDPMAIPFSTRIIKSYVNCNFSFNGLQTASAMYVLNQEKKLELKPDELIPDYPDLCASLQWGIARHLCQRLELAFIYLHQNKTFGESEKVLVVSGGVASNNFIREALKYVCDVYEYRLVVPPAKFCTDNGIMVAWNGIEKLKENCQLVSPDELDSVSPIAACSLGENLSSVVESQLWKTSRNYIRLTHFIKNYKAKGKNVEEEIKT